MATRIQERLLTGGSLVSQSGGIRGGCPALLGLIDETARRVGQPVCGLNHGDRCSHGVASKEGLMKRFVVPVRFARRLPDPVFPNCERHIIMCAVTDLPADLPRDLVTRATIA